MRTKAILSIALAVWLLPPAGLITAMARAPNVVLRQADVGTFISARSGFGDVTTIRTTLGTLVVADMVTALRGEPLVIVDSTVYGVQVCDRHAMTACMDLVGRYVGVLPRVAHGAVRLTFGRREFLDNLALSWFLIGPPVIGVIVLALLDANTDQDDTGDGDRGHDASRRPE